MCYIPLGRFFCGVFCADSCGRRAGLARGTAGNIRTISTSTSRLALGEKPTSWGPGWGAFTGATIPSNTTDAYLRKVLAAGGFKAYEKAHRQALVALAAKAFPRLPTDVAGHVVAFAFHVGYY